MGKKKRLRALKAQQQNEEAIIMEQVVHLLSNATKGVQFLTKSREAVNAYLKLKKPSTELKEKVVPLGIVAQTQKNYTFDGSITRFFESGEWESARYGLIPNEYFTDAFVDKTIYFDFSDNPLLQKTMKAAGVYIRLISTSDQSYELHYVKHQVNGRLKYDARRCNLVLDNMIQDPSPWTMFTNKIWALLYVVMRSSSEAQ